MDLLKIIIIIKLQTQNHCQCTVYTIYASLSILARAYSKYSIFFYSNRNKPKLNLFRLFLICFAKPKYIFSVCFGVSDQYQNNRNKQNFFETNRKNRQKTLSIKVSSKQLIFFGCFVCFSVCFAKPKRKCWFISVFRTGIETT